MNELPRSEWIKIINTALARRNWDFARKAAEAYLNAIPNDLEVGLLLGKALLGMGDMKRAAALSASLTAADPEFAAAYSVWAQSLPPNAEEQAMIGAALTALSAPRPRPDMPPPAAWGKTLQKALQALQKHDLERAQGLLFTALPGNDDVALLAVAHLRLIWAEGDWAATLHLARRYHNRFPKALPIRLILAHHLAQSGHEAESVALLHQAATDDPAQQVVRRLFGAEHPYRALWESDLRASFDLPLPADVASALGKNLLVDSAIPAKANKPKAKAPIPSTAAQNTTSSPPPSPPESKADDAKPAPPPSLKEVAKRLIVPPPTEADGRFPCYVVVSSLNGLKKRYGQGAAKVVLEHAQRLVEAVAARPDWEAILLVVDDAVSAHSHGVKPVNATDPWAIKRQLAALDEALAKRGTMVGAVLIVGGDAVIPFHQLPNPVEDADEVIYSDNPYGARDENFLVPEWPVGRLPGSADGDVGLLLSGLRRMIAYHRAQQVRARWWKRLWERIKRRMRPRRKANVGYAAEVWERAAIGVFRSIGSPKALWVSPPLQAESVEIWPRADLGYFNLHGVADAAPWYGQSDPTRPDTESPDYPVALRPQDVPQNGRLPKVVVSEACYGAHVFGKTPQISIALRFLLNGVHAFIGSTATAYASLEPPLVGADLLIRIFWQRLKAGAPAGEALRQAKVYYAREMHRKQGFLDGGDQKTLTSFVLYGDPLYSWSTASMQAKSVLRPQHSMPVLAAREHPLENAALPPRVLKQVKQMARAYLPGADGFHVQVAAEELGNGDNRAKGGGLRGKVVVASKSVPVASFTHRHYVRITLDAKGKVVKVAVSR